MNIQNAKEATEVEELRQTTITNETPPVSGLSKARAWYSKYYNANLNRRPGLHLAVLILVLLILYLLASIFLHAGSYSN